MNTSYYTHCSTEIHWTTVQKLIQIVRFTMTEYVKGFYSADSANDWNQEHVMSKSFLANAKAGDWKHRISLRCMINLRWFLQHRYISHFSKFPRSTLNHLSLMDQRRPRSDRHLCDRIYREGSKALQPYSDDLPGTVDVYQPSWCWLQCVHHSDGSGSISSALWNRGYSVV